MLFRKDAVGDKARFVSLMAGVVGLATLLAATHKNWTLAPILLAFALWTLPPVVCAGWFGEGRRAFGALAGVGAAVVGGGVGGLAGGPNAASDPVMAEVALIAAAVVCLLVCTAAEKRRERAAIADGQR